MWWVGSGVGCGDNDEDNGLLEIEGFMLGEYFSFGEEGWNFG